MRLQLCLMVLAWVLLAPSTHAEESAASPTPEATPHTPQADPIGDLQTQLQAHPDQALLYYNLGNLYQQQTAWKDAETAYRQALKLQPTLRPALHNLALLYLQQAQPAQAKALLEPALQQWRVDASLHRLLGHAYQALDDPDRARSAFQNALALMPSPEARSHLRSLLPALDAVPWPEAQQKAYTQGLSHLEHKAWAAAQQSFRQAQQAGPPQADIYYRIAQVAQAQQQPEQARKAWNDTLRLNPAYTAARQALAEDYRHSGNIPASIRAYQTLLQYRPAHMSAYGPLAQLLERQQQWEAARQEREQLQSLNTCLGDNPYRLAALYVRTGHPDKAQPLLKQQLACQPLAEAHLLLAQLAQPEQATALYQTATERWPQSAPVWAAYAQWELSQGRLTSAMSAADKALKLNPHNPDVRFVQAQLALHKGQPEQGLKLLESLVQQYPNPEYQRQRLLALVQTGQYAQALPAIQSHMQRYPNERTTWEPLVQQINHTLKQRKGRF